MEAMTPQSLIRGLLEAEWAELKARNNGFSLRAYAKRLGVSPSVLSEVLNGKRVVTPKMAERLSSVMVLDPVKREQLLEVFQAEKIQPKTSTNIVRLQADQYKSIAEWYHFAILSLAETDSFQSDSTWIAQRLNISPSQAQAALERLMRLGMLKENAKGQLVATNEMVSSPDNIPNSTLKMAHVQNLEMAKESLFKNATDERDITAITLAINPDKLPEAKKRVRAFMAELKELLGSGSKSEVYKFCCQIFPLTELKEKE